MPDHRFSTPGADARFPTPGTDVRFQTPGLDARFQGGVDTRFNPGSAYGNPNPGAGGSWLLAGGVWNDGGVWDDTAFWEDS